MAALVSAGPVSVGTTATLIYAAGAQTFVKKLTLSNASTTVGSFVTVYLCRGGSGPSSTNTIIQAQSVPAENCYVSPEFSGVTMQPGDTIQSLASSPVNAVLSGVVL